MQPRPALPLGGIGRWKLGEPGIEGFQLVHRRIKEYYAHSYVLLNVEDFSSGEKRSLVAGDAHIEQGSHGERIHNVHVATLAAYLRDPSRKLGGACGVRELRRGDKRIAGYTTPLGRRRRILWRTWRVSQCRVSLTQVCMNAALPEGIGNQSDTKEPTLAVC